MNRKEAIAYLTNNGKDNNLLCFSRFGRTTRDCAPVAWRFAFLMARECGSEIDEELLDDAMSRVVNDSDSVPYLIRRYGHYMYR